MGNLRRIPGQHKRNDRITQRSPETQNRSSDKASRGLGQDNPQECLRWGHSQGYGRELRFRTELAQLGVDHQDYGGKDQHRQGD